jgi:branched-chain amino acid transport system ATP-binding protein
MLKVNSIESYYGSVKVLDKISIEVDEGEVVTIIGANGAGKTTLLKSIMNLITPREGEIFFLNEKINRVETEKIVARGISLIPEGRQVFPSMSVLENLQLGAFLRYRKVKSSEISKSFDFVYNLFPALKERTNQKAGTLSGGEQQMLAIGRGLMSKPKLLLLDEPSMGLAPVLIKEIFIGLKKLHQEGLTILLVEQDANIALSLADRGYVLQTGKVVLTDSGENLIKNKLVKEIYFGKSL